MANIKKWFYLTVTVLGVVAISCSTKQKISIQRFTLQDIGKRSTALIDNRPVINNPGKAKYERAFSCKSLDSYYYEPANPNFYTDRRIRVNFHFVNSRDSLHNYNGDEGIKYAKELIYYANKKLALGTKMNLPEGNNTPIYPVPYRYELTPDGEIEDDDGIYFHYLDEPFFINEGKNSNNYNREIVKKLEVNMDSVLNIFYMAHHPDSIASMTYKGKKSGIALGNAVKLGINFSKPANSWTYSSLLNHEIGHVLGLSHAWNKNDGCEDTPGHPNCWNTGAPPCDGPVSNNVMDYNSEQTAFTPCQIARAYRTLTKTSSKKRNLVIKDWCKMSADSDIIIRDTVTWSRPMDLKGNLIISQTGVLHIKCKLNMAKDSYIKVQGGGQLILENATIYNDCGYLWDGILTQDSRVNPARIEYLDTFYLENIENIVAK